MFFAETGITGYHFREDIKLLCKLLVPNFDNTSPFTMEDTELTRIFSKLCSIGPPEEIPTTSSSNIASVICEYFVRNKKIKAAVKSTLTIVDIVQFIGKLQDASKKKKGTFQYFSGVIPKCTLVELQMILKLLTNNLEVNVSLKNILDIIHSDAFEFYKTNRNIDTVMKTYLFVVSLYIN